MASIPTSTPEFTADWLNEVLAGQLGGARITSATVVASDIPGQTAEVAKLHLAFDRDDVNVPSDLVIKYRTKDEAVINSVINVYQQYWRETSFYREFPDPGIPVPRCLHVDHDPQSQAFVIVMADLAPAESPSWASTPEQVAEAISHLPALHAKWWNSDVLRSKDWLIQYDNMDFYRAAAGAAGASVPRLRELFGDSAAATIQLMEMWATNVDRAAEYVASRPFTLVHTDYHPKQIFFPTAEGGEFAVIDWQFCFVAQGAWDLVRMMTLGQDVENRRARERDLIDRYHAALVAEGVTGYSVSDLEDDLRLGLVVNQQIMSIACADTDISIFARECEGLGLDWKDVILLRGEAAVQDWGVVEFLEWL